jgi:hypothetical protein
MAKQKVCIVFWCIAQTRDGRDYCPMHAELPPKHSQERRESYLARWQQRIRRKRAKQPPPPAPPAQDPLFPEAMDYEPNVAQPALGRWSPGPFIDPAS